MSPSIPELNIEIVMGESGAKKLEIRLTPGRRGTT